MIHHLISLVPPWLMVWLPPILLAILAALIPETFLDSPYTTIPHETSIDLRYLLLFLGFTYVAVALFARLGLHAQAWWNSRRAQRTPRGFPLD